MILFQMKINFMNLYQELILIEWDDDIYGIEFFATAPKSYGYVLNTGEKTMKIKGISLNQHQVQIVKPGKKNKENIIKSTRIFDLDMMKSIIFNNKLQVKVKNDSHFKIIKNENIIKCEELIKTFQFNYDKHRILPYKKYNDGI